MKSVCVFCGSALGQRPAYVHAARELGAEAAKRGVRVVYGGANVGLMGELANAALEAGGEVLGVIPTFLAQREIEHRGLTQLIEVGSMHERKNLMASHADAFISLPGGFGTLDELFEMLTWSQIGLHHKPSALLNVDGYYDQLLAFLDTAREAGLVRSEHLAVLQVARDAKGVLDLLAAAQ